MIPLPRWLLIGVVIPAWLLIELKVIPLWSPWPEITANIEALLVSTPQPKQAQPTPDTEEFFRVDTEDSKTSINLAGKIKVVFDEKSGSKCPQVFMEDPSPADSGQKQIALKK